MFRSIKVVARARPPGKRVDETPRARMRTEEMKEYRISGSRDNRARTRTTRPGKVDVVFASPRQVYNHRRKIDRLPGAIDRARIRGRESSGVAPGFLVNFPARRRCVASVCVPVGTARKSLLLEFHLARTFIAVPRPRPRAPVAYRTSSIGTARAAARSYRGLKFPSERTIIAPMYAG